jgi:HK97 family phage prohead protease
VKTKKTSPKYADRTQFHSAGARVKLTRQTMAAAKDGAKPVADAAEPKITLKGYAMLWNELSSDRGGYAVKLATGSAIFTNPCLALFHHDFQTVLGNTANGTLRLLPDAKGVAVEIDLPDTTAAADVAELVEDAYVQGMSFSMANGFEEFTEEKTGDKTILTVTKFTCDEVTVTAIPAFASTTIAKEFDDEKDDDEDDDDDEDYGDRAKQSARLDKLRLEMTKL